MVAYDEDSGSSILGSVDIERLKGILKEPEGLAIALVVALGYPEKNLVVEMVKNGDMKYLIDEHGVLNTPKKDLKCIIRWNSCLEQ